VKISIIHASLVFTNNRKFVPVYSAYAAISS